MNIYFLVITKTSSFVMEVSTSWLENDFAESRHIEHSTGISCLLEYDYIYQDSFFISIKFSNKFCGVIVDQFIY
jgi:hypothetical protein